ncbi:MAG: DUF1318 domain-containing protein [Opitutaceae bacterium]|nr:DUF1318 domain-containing protein [Opitutaceae bacterium]
MNAFLRFLLLGVFSFVALSASAEDIATVQRRTAERQSAVDSIKMRGAAGENNRGFLESRSGASSQDDAVISAENSDRSVLYAEAARRAGTSADAVGKVRAKKIAEMSTPGIWLQDESGKWYKK